MGARAPASRLPPPAPRAPRPSSAARVREASPRRPALPRGWRASRPPAPFQARDPPVSLQRSRLPTSAAGCHPPALSLTLHWTFHLGFFLSFIPPFNFFLPNWPPLAFLPVDGLVLRLLKNQNQSVFNLEFEGRVSLAACGRVFFFPLYIPKPGGIGA